MNYTSVQYTFEEIHKDAFSVLKGRVLIGKKQYKMYSALVS